ncbi:EF-P lysine aminoacylase GenX [Solimonas sp. K1W22B-7]|uniref:EF-P lysine aminoacylase EpmA n=1 Tax=Solimonas sp. K1W22B-7 TaxID=2303331 RepID=UPI000E33037A|nr:EF-P lysine aminoacylase EpmA [Solimonas sp. K1W22B-7]AXQ29086.1 EF-P lysine aminoacylase GenX [Solimonas sp. K1W22B-7]
MNWNPSADLPTVRARAALLAALRAFFAARGVLEVETPLLSAHATVDRHIDSFRTADGRWLHTSPEFAMKRLLCAGSGPIWQVCRVFRREESGRHHNPEFTMLEWYRPGHDHHALMGEVEALVAELAAALGRPLAGGMERLSYRQAFGRHLGLDPFVAGVREVREALQGAGHDAGDIGGDDRDVWLDVAMSLAVGPRLGLETPCFLYDFPASQAALSRIRRDDPPVAERFELFWRGVELANGFHELGDAAEQRQRFEAEQQWRLGQGREVPPYDRHLIEALAQGLPECAGVALGLDRLLMLLLGKATLADVLAFDSGRA